MSSFNPRGRIVLCAASMVSMVLGSIHAFSVFIEPLEATFEISRATVSLIYSFSLVFLTIAVLFGPTVYSRLQPVTIYVSVVILGAIGAAVAGFGDSLETVFIGYSFIFGIANGLGYGFGLQFAARANPECSGFAMGVVTAAYAFGAVLAPYGFELVLAFGGFSSAMAALGISVMAMGTVAAILVAQSSEQYSDQQTVTTVFNLPAARIAMIWVAYACGVSAGLMAIGHAAGIAEIAGSSGWIAAAVIASCNLVGSLFSGWYSDKGSHRKILTVMPLLGAMALLTLSVFPVLSIALLGVIGFAYGGIIATYPAAIAIQFPGENGPRAYGRVFTAWGVAGLLAPWLAGQIYDWRGDYTPALLIAALLGTISAITAQKAIE